MINDKDELVFAQSTRLVWGNILRAPQIFL